MPTLPHQAPSPSDRITPLCGAATGAASAERLRTRGYFRGTEADESTANAEVTAALTTKGVAPRES